MDVKIVIFDGFDELDAIAPFEVLSNAAAMGCDLAVSLASLHGEKEIETNHGLRVLCTQQLNLDAPPDLLIVPGGGWLNRLPKSAWGEAQRGELPDMLRKLHDAGTLMASVCTGGMLLSAAGLLVDRPAVTHPAALDELKASGAKTVDARVVDDGDIITAGGVTSGIDLALWLTERFFGTDIAFRLEKLLDYERRGVVWRSGSGGSRASAR